jgi:RimJ/RimL family protein N-acetyltransferase
MSAPEVSIRPLGAADTEIVATWLADERVHRWLSGEWRQPRVDATLVALAARKRTNKLFVFDSGGAPCGVVALSDIDAVDQTAMVWYFLGCAERSRRGLTTAAVRLLVASAFDRFDLHSLYAWIVDGNVASAALLKKIGFRAAGRHRQGTWLIGQRADRVYYDLLRDEFAALQAHGTHTRVGA